MNNNREKPMKKVSVILVVKDQCDLLREKLPNLFSQQCEGDYEVIIVDQHSTDDTAELLKTMKEQYSNLYTTFIPQYLFQRDPRRLAFTVGIKAAKGEWVVCSDIDSLPSSETWLSELTDNCTPATEVLLGYVKRKNNDVQLKVYDSISDVLQIVSKAEQHRGQEKSGWMHFGRRDYDFFVVRRRQGHEILQSFETTRMKRL